MFGYNQLCAVRQPRCYLYSFGISRELPSNGYPTLTRVYSYELLHKKIVFLNPLKNFKNKVLQQQSFTTGLLSSQWVADPVTSSNDSPTPPQGNNKFYHKKIVAVSKNTCTVAAPIFHHWILLQFISIFTVFIQQESVKCPL